METTLILWIERMVFFASLIWSIRQFMLCNTKHSTLLATEMLLIVLQIFLVLYPPHWSITALFVALIVYFDKMAKKIKRNVYDTDTRRPARDIPKV